MRKKKLKEVGNVEMNEGALDKAESWLEASTSSSVCVRVSRVPCFLCDNHH